MDKLSIKDFTDFLNHFKDDYFRTITEISKPKNRNKSLVDNKFKMFSFDDMCRKYPSMNALPPKTMDALYYKLDEEGKLTLYLIEFKTTNIEGNKSTYALIEAIHRKLKSLNNRTIDRSSDEKIISDNTLKKFTKIKVVRIFNTYGPYMDPKDGRVVTNFIMQALKNENITIYGDGNQTRSFCYVDDMVEGLIKMMKTEDEFTGPVNLGNPCEFTILEFGKKVIDKTNSDSQITHCPLPHDDPTQRKPDISLAKENLNWQPKIMLDEGLDKTIEYYKQII